MEESLESGWVSVRPNVFEEKEKHKFVFIVAWNDIEGKFAVTCHDRTVQKRLAARDSVAAEDEEEEAAVDKRPVASLKSSRQKGCEKPKTFTRSPSRTAALSADIEVLEPAADARALDDPDSMHSVGDSSWAGLFSFQDLRAAHAQLCAVNSDLEPCLPPFPEQDQQSAVFWSVLFGVPEVTLQDTEALCYQLQVYLGHALDTCGWKILSQVLFADGDDSEEYYESLSELRQKGYEDALQRQKKRLHEVRPGTG